MAKNEDYRTYSLLVRPSGCFVLLDFVEDMLVSMVLLIMQFDGSGLPKSLPCLVVSNEQ